MSRLTGSDAKNLMEAYAAIYAPQEITEEQIWEEVENWVNSLLEEGYDLSEYTWEDMYEAYLSEYVHPEQAQQARKASQGDQSGARKALQSGRSLNVGGAFGGSTVRMNSGETKKQGRTVLNTTNTGPLRGAADPTITLGGRKFDRLTRGDKIDYIERKPAKPSVSPNQRPGGSPGAGGRTGGSSGGGGAPAAPKPSSSKVVPTGPAAPAKPATGMLGKTSFERRTPTSAELKAAQAARASGASPEKALQAAKSAGTTAKIQSAGQQAGAKAFSSPTSGASAFKPSTVAAAPSTSAAASGSVAPATAALAATPKPTPVAPRQTAREKMLNQSYEYDAFDLVLEYLIDYGHVETVDEALYVMMEMDAEVIQDIVEGSYEDRIADNNKKYDRNRKRAAQRAAARNAARDAGQTGAVPGVGYVTPRRERETYTDSAGVERHKTGAKMPKKD